MSTLPSLASKGEKAKPRFQSLDINNLYRVSLGENLESKQQKSTLSQKHGMQSLGKVPNARRPPANLPSLKSEHTGNDAAVPLVPSNGSGWGNKQESSPTASATITTNSTTTTNSTNSNAQQQPIQLLTPQQQAAIALLPAATSAITTAPSSTQHQQQIVNHQKLHHPPPLSSSSVAPASTDKSWSAVMSGTDPNSHHPPPYQSPQFQHEFPSLTAADGGGGGGALGVAPPTRGGTDLQYGPGPSLRPQTEGSWIQGGSQQQQQLQQQRGPGGNDGRHSSAAPGVPPQLSAPGGQPLPPQVLGFVPTFMYRGNNYPANGHSGPPGTTLQQQQFALAHNNARRAAERMRNPDADELAQRPIIKEEDLSGMDSLTNDMGWAINDDIDYNQKLAFSDDEKSDDVLRKSRMRPSNNKTEAHFHEHKSSSWNKQTITNNQNRASKMDDEEISAQRRRQQQDIASAVERAKQRKEEEEKKFLETKQAAAKKLQELDERMGKKRDNDENAGTIPPNLVPQQAIAPVPILLPEWEREKEARAKTASSTAVSTTTATTPLPVESDDKRQNSDFRQMAQQMDRFSSNRSSAKDVRNEKEQQQQQQQQQQIIMGPNFSKQFQNNLPPRFQKKQTATATTTGSSSNSSGTSSQSFYDSSNRWSQSSSRTSPNNSNNRKVRSGDIEEKEQDDRYRQRGHEDYSNRHRYSESGRKSSDSRYEDYKERDYKDRDYKEKDYKEKDYKEKDYKEKDYKEKDYKEKDYKKEEENRNAKLDSFDVLLSRQSSSDEWHSTEKLPSKYDRPQRPDSRDSRASRESRHSDRDSHQSRHSEPREYSTTSWADSQFKEPFEERRKEHRMVVPGPITKEKMMEADDMRNEKRNLTALKRGGSISDKKLQEKSADDNNWSSRHKNSQAWSSGDVNPLQESSSKCSEEEKREREEEKDKFSERDNEKKMHSRGRSDSQGNRNPGWSSGGNSAPIVYRNSWTNNKKNPVRNPPRNPSTLLKHSKELDLESGSNDDIVEMKAVSEKNIEIKETEKKEKTFVARGEPSRHGRGAANSYNRLGSGGGGRGAKQRMDGYGPPSAKSPFSHASDVGDHKKGDPESEEDKLKSSSNKNLNKLDDKRRKPGDLRKNPKVKDDNSDNSDADARKPKTTSSSSSSSNRPISIGVARRGGSTSRPLSDKRPFGGPNRNELNRHNSNGNISTRSKDSSRDNNVKDKESSNLVNAIVDNALKENEIADDLIQKEDDFQEVKNNSKRIDKPDNRKDEKSSVVQPLVKSDQKDMNKKNIKPVSQMSQQQIANIPSLMATPVNPPPSMTQSQPKGGGNQFHRQNQAKVPPRFMKARENRMHKGPPMHSEDVAKVNQSSMYGIKDAGGSANNTSTMSNSIGNAWDKPLSSQLRTGLDQELGLESTSSKSNDASSVHPNALVGDDKTVLDSSKPLNTIIFENTNYKSAPGPRGRNQEVKNRTETIDSLNQFNSNKPIVDLLAKEKDNIQMPQLFNKEDSADMKLDFLESEISQITEDKSNSNKNLSMSRTMHNNLPPSNNNSAISTADALNMKIQSVKKVWDVMEQHNNDETSFVSFSDGNVIDPDSAFRGTNDVVDDNHDVYNASPNQVASNSTTNVCKVKPTQQVAGSAAGQAILAAAAHQQHSIVGPGGLMGHSIASPPPMQPILGSGVGLGQPPQQYATNQHISYQTSLGGTQYGMPAHSPPTVLYNSTQQLPAQAGLYSTFQIDQSQVINNQGRSQFSQFSYNLGQTASSPYSQYMPTAQPQHAPPTAQAPPPPPDLYQNMSNFRITNTGPFGQSQQLNNPATVLISSSSNSLMSSTVKPSNQQISAIGTKAGGVGQAYQQSPQQGQQMYMNMYDSIPASYLQNTGVLQRAPTVQNNVVPGLQPSALQPSSSYYSGSAGGQTNYYPGPGNSSLQSAQMQQHQAASGYGGLQGNMFNTHNQSHTNAPMQNYSAYLSGGPMQLTMNAAPFRQSANNSYMKSGGQPLGADQGRQQLKSPGSQQQEVLSSVFNSVPQIASPKSRQVKQAPPQQSPTAQQHKYLYNTNINNGQQQQQGGQQQQVRYPAPIQRPATNYQNNQSLGNNPQNNANKHRSNNNPNSNNRASGRYYNQGGPINTHHVDKNDDSKLSESMNAAAAASKAASNSSSTAIAGAKATVISSVSQTVMEKSDPKEDSCLKD